MNNVTNLHVILFNQLVLKHYIYIDSEGNCLSVTRHPYIEKKLEKKSDIELNGPDNDTDQHMHIYNKMRKVLFMRH